MPHLVRARFPGVFRRRRGVQYYRRPVHRFYLNGIRLLGKHTSNLRKQVVRLTAS